MELNSTLDRLKKYEPIDTELKKAKAKYPNWPQDNIFEQVSIITEEAGEIARQTNQYKREGGSLSKVKSELIQTSAMCMRMLEAIKDLPEHCY